MKRRQFLSLAAKTFLGVGVGGSLVALAAAFRCTVNRQEVFLEGLPPELSGFRIVLISDLHHSEWISRAYLRSVVRLANSLHPDLVTLTGDYIHCGGIWVPGCMRELAKLKARHGKVAVLGNHDHYQRAAPVVRDGLRKAGIDDLSNRGVFVRRDGAELRVGGVGDYWSEKQNLKSALAGASGRKSAILLSHNPDFAEEIHDERVGLVLSGHTHGGQCVFPLIGAPVTSTAYGKKYLSGLCQGPVTPVFVTCGAGSSFPPIRIGCPPEIALLTLRSGRAS